MSTATIPLPSLGARARALWASYRTWLILLPAILLGALLAVGLTIHAKAAARYATQPVARGTLVATVSASGTVNPQNLISVGTQVSGTIAQIDVDYNSKVRKGQVLARIDPSTFQAQLEQAQAQLAQARAQAAQAQAVARGAQTGVSIAGADAAALQAAVASAQANVQKAQATLVLARQTQARDQALLANGYIAQSTVDTDRSNTAQDEAAVAAAQAALAQAGAQAQAGEQSIGQNGSTAQSQLAAAQAAAAAVVSAQAAVQQDQVNLDHTVITSPVDGTVVARDVSVGQTVAASLQTPTLFTIAQDLRKMEVDINVGEPDIGNVKPGDAVSFSVLAYPNRIFHGTVSQVRINPQTVDNVVTYDVVVLADNADGALLPGMTANATIAVATAKNALLVPIAALQWKPNASAVARSPWGTLAGASASATVTGGSTGTLYVQRNGSPAGVPVRVILANQTEAAVAPLNAPTLAPGDSVIVASASAPARAQNAAPAGGMRGFRP